MPQFAELDARLFQGVIPATIATCSRSGEPNLTYLSQVHRVDDRHVALSCQFFNKTKLNLLENPHATLVMYDPIGFEAYRLELLYKHSEEEGPLFESMATRIQAIASHTGMKGIFKLQSADVCEVRSCSELEGFLEPPSTVRPRVDLDITEEHSEMRALQLVSRCIGRAEGFSDLLEEVLATLDDALGFSHSMVLVPTPDGGCLRTVASRGYGNLDMGAEIGIGEGLIGTVAKEMRQIRMSCVDAELRYGRAVRQATHRSVGRSAVQSEVPLPGLVNASSQMAIPLVVSRRLVGVIAVESSKPLAFDEWDEAFLEIVASQIAALLDARSERTREPEPVADTQPPLLFRFFPADDCVFIGDDYLVRNVPGRILWKLLRTRVETGRADFSNRELRLDPWLKLPPIRDNLESRLSLLKKRLEQKCPDLRVVSTGRGAFRLESDRELQLQEVAGTAPPEP